MSKHSVVLYSTSVPTLPKVRNDIATIKRILEGKRVQYEEVRPLLDGSDVLLLLCLWLLTGAAVALAVAVGLMLLCFAAGGPSMESGPQSCHACRQ